MGKRSGNRKYHCWIEGREHPHEGQTIWRKHAASAASERAADHWLESKELGPYVVNVVGAERQLRRFRVTLTVFDDVVLKSGKKGRQLQSVTEEIDESGKVMPLRAG